MEGSLEGERVELKSEMTYQLRLIGRELQESTSFSPEMDKKMIIKTNLLRRIQSRKVDGTTK